MRGILRRTFNVLSRSQPGRWILSALLLVMGAVFFGLSFTTTGDNALSLLIGGVLFLILGAVVLVFTVLISTRTRSAQSGG